MQGCLSFGSNASEAADGCLLNSPGLAAPPAPGVRSSFPCNAALAAVSGVKGVLGVPIPPAPGVTPSPELVLAPLKADRSGVGASLSEPRAPVGGVRLGKCRP
jgi:hypothetical protein